MTDAEIRGRLLAHFHALRHDNGGWVPASEIILAPEPVTLRVVGGVCQQLADIGLIQWKPLHGSNGIAAGTAKITGQGVSVVESGRSADIDIRFASKNETAPSVPSRDLGLLPPPGAAPDLSSSSSLTDAVRNLAITESLGISGSLADVARQLGAQSDREQSPPSSYARSPSSKGDDLSQQDVPPPTSPRGGRSEIITLKPTFMGMSVDLKELGRRCWPWVKRRFGMPS